MAVAGRPEIEVEVFTTRPDTSFGMTYAVLAPEHPLVVELVTEPQREAVAELSARAQQETDIERQSSEGSLEKRGAFTGSYCVNPFNDELVPIYVADYVLMGYGTGAIMAVPAEDERDFAFAEAYGLPLCARSSHRRISPAAPMRRRRQDQQRVPERTGRAAAKRAGDRILEERGIGARKVHYRLRDWLISRQRYWGCPIPLSTAPPTAWHPCGRRAADPPARDVIPPDGRVAAALRRGFLEHDLPDLRWPGESRDGHDGTPSWTRRGTSCAFATAGRDGPGRHPGRPALHACRPVHRRHHPRDLHLLYARFYTRALADTGLGPKEVREPFSQLSARG